MTRTTCLGQAGGIEAPAPQDFPGRIRSPPGASTGVTALLLPARSPSPQLGCQSPAELPRPAGASLGDPQGQHRGTAGTGEQRGSCRFSPAERSQHTLSPALQPSTVAAAAPQPSPGWIRPSRAPERCTSAGFPLEPGSGADSVSDGVWSSPAPVSCPSIFSGWNVSLGLSSPAQEGTDLQSNKCMKGEFEAAAAAAGVQRGSC